jgi:hypothetical protein
MTTTPQQRTCGRPTKAGTPCKTRIHGRGEACTIHTTAEEQALAAAYDAGHRAGYAEGRRSGEMTARISTENLERQLAHLTAALDKATRKFTLDGAQAVTVDGYGYLWRGTPELAVGDHVLLPENYVSRMRNGPGPFPGTVTDLGTTYDGDLTYIVRRAT